MKEGFRKKVDCWKSVLPSGENLRETVKMEETKTDLSPVPDKTEGKSYLQTISVLIY